MRKITFKECPRPQFVRRGYRLLNGKWGFAFDYDNKGEEAKYFNGFEKQYDIKVPFVYETKASGIGITKRCDNVWYQRELEIEKDDKRIILHFEGSDFVTKLYINGKFVGQDQGAYHRISFDITDYVNNGKNLMVVKCEDDYSTEKPRGKQRWEDENFGCWYVDTTGIYKPVWLEKVSTSYVKDVKITPLVNEKKVVLEYELVNAIGSTLKSIVKFEGTKVVAKQAKVKDNKVKVEINMPNDIALWDIVNPNLYDLKIKLVKDGKVCDAVSSYFGFREVIAKDGKIYLNGKELYQKLVLDQGYFEKSHLTAPSNKALYEDITKMMECGFNGCRKHQKVEDERFVYYADVLGYLMWAEMPSMYANTAKSRAEFEKEWMLVVKQQYNHPCIITWTPLNESWGVGDIKTRKVEQDFANLIYHVTKEYDPYRFVITNDGWEHTISDIITIHHYEQDGEKLYSYYDTLDKALKTPWEAHHKGAFADGYEYKGQPIMISEFGGTAFAKIAQNGNWGYGNGVKDDEEYVTRLAGLFGALNKLAYSSGYCYTQVSDVQQEVNGLVFENRKFKVDPSLIKAIQDKRN